MTINRVVHFKDAIYKVLLDFHDNAEVAVD